MQRYTMALQAPRPRDQEQRGLRVLMSDLRLDTASSSACSTTNELFYAGTQKFTVGVKPGMTTGKEDGEALLLKQVVYDVAMP